MYDNYTMEILNKAFLVGNPLAPLSLLFLFLGRMLPIIAFAPFFGAKVMPHPVKVAFALSLFVILMPFLIDITTTQLTFNHMLIILFVKELFIGSILGFLITIPFMVVQNAGMIIDHQRGGASLMINDPTVQNQSSPLGTLFNMVLIIIFFYVDAPFVFLDAIVQSYEVIPPDQFFSGAFFHKESPFWQQMFVVFNKIMVLSIEMATPGLLMILMTDFFLGIANRLAPQVQITFLGMPLKSLLALAVICFGWHAYIETFAKESRSWVRYLQELINMFKLGQ